MTIRTNSSHKIISLLVVLAMAGCSSSGNFLQADRIDYKSASAKKEAATSLDVPPDLSQISRDNRYSIPENGTTGPLTASSFNAKSSGTAVQSTTSTSTSSASVALNSLQGMHIERDGSERWLSVKQSPEVLWPKIKDFWQENGFVLNQESEATGVMETDWAENRAKLPQDIIRKTIGYVFDSLYSTGERDKFRTRLERGPDGTTEIYISHRGLEEAVTGQEKDGVTWTNRAVDPGLEAAFLTRLMVRLGETPEKAKEIANAPVIQAAKAKMVKDGTTSTIEVDESFDRAWRRVGLALDRVNFTVEDRDRNQGIYFVRYVDQDAETSAKDFLSSLFFNDKDKNTKRFRIFVKGVNNVTRVSVQNNDGGVENSAASDKILNLVLEQLK